MNKKDIEKIKKHIQKVPTYNTRTKENKAKYKKANELMDGTLDKVVIWFRELCRMMDIEVPIEE